MIYLTLFFLNIKKFIFNIKFYNIQIYSTILFYFMIYVWNVSLRNIFRGRLLRLKQRERKNFIWTHEF